MRMPLRLPNAPGTFQRTTDVALSEVKQQFRLECLDDVGILSRGPTEHIIDVRKVITLLNNAGVSLKLKKRRFFTEAIDYLRYIIRPRRLEISSHTTEAIHGPKSPTNLTELRSILMLFNICSRFVRNFARLAAPLNKKLRKVQSSTFQALNEEVLLSVQSQKNALISLPVLAFPDSIFYIAHNTDACDVQIGRVLLQE